MIGFRLLAPGVAFVALLACIPAVSAQSTDPVSVLQRYYEARTRGDLAGAMSMVAPDAIYTTGPCAPVCVGAGDIAQREVGPALANHGQYTAVGVSVSGTTVTLQLEVRNDVSKLAGIDRLLNDITAEVQDGKIVAYSAVSVLSDPQSATYVAFARSQAAGQTTPAQIPTALPRTGELAARPPLPFLGGAVLLAAGLLLRAWSRRRSPSPIGVSNRSWTPTTALAGLTAACVVTRSPEKRGVSRSRSRLKAVGTHGVRFVERMTGSQQSERWTGDGL